jgi:hypothetical protein
MTSATSHRDNQSFFYQCAQEAFELYFEPVTQFLAWIGRTLGSVSQTLQRRYDSTLLKKTLRNLSENRRLTNLALEGFSAAPLNFHPDIGSAWIDRECIIEPEQVRLAARRLASPFGRQRVDPIAFEKWLLSPECTASRTKVFEKLLRDPRTLRARIQLLAGSLKAPDFMLLRVSALESLFVRDSSDELAGIIRRQSHAIESWLFEPEDLQRVAFESRLNDQNECINDASRAWAPSMLRFELQARALELFRFAKQLRNELARVERLRSRCEMGAPNENTESIDRVLLAANSALELMALRAHLERSIRQKDQASNWRRQPVLCAIEHVFAWRIDRAARALPALPMN